MKGNINLIVHKDNILTVFQEINGYGGKNDIPDSFNNMKLFITILKRVIIMTNVKIKDRIISLAFFTLLVGCKENKVEKQEVKKPLVFEVNFKDFGDYQIDFDKSNWKSHEKDSIVYFKFNLYNIKKESFVIKTSLISPNIPFLIRYKKLDKVEKFTDGTKNEYLNININQQFNTIYNDSLILKDIASADFPIVEQSFKIGYQHIGVDEICQLEVNQYQDTIDISNHKIKGCIERQR
ncbi:hypothetical protein QF023_002221 [Chryseobacterium sp. SLBN-27]|uniref:hypothetical protein n=1 Tax=Chryseobacterium sp. SLBN-27 TaxID=3042287 RepID=UPI0028544C70|nr:hypothetical protein [Chryseobacterium sp. SLBN-27]MDR6158705.1 hypothetical protein [Chryseobacterium sp. SLBN-27]